MSFLGLVRREMEGSLPRLALMSALGGLSNAAILASVNAGAQPAEAGQPDFWSAALFVISLILYIKTQNYILITATAEIEAVVHRIRIKSSMKCGSRNWPRSKLSGDQTSLWP